MPHTNAARINRRVLTRWTVTDLGSRRAPEATSHRPPGSPPKPDPRGSSLWNRRPDDHIRYDTASHHLARHDLTRGDLSYRRAADPRLGSHPHRRRRYQRRRPGRTGHPLLVLGTHLTDLQGRSPDSRRGRSKVRLHRHRRGRLGPQRRRPGRSRGMGHRHVPQHRRPWPDLVTLRCLRTAGCHRRYGQRGGSRPHGCPRQSRLPGPRRPGARCLILVSSSFLALHGCGRRRARFAR